MTTIPDINVTSSLILDKTVLVVGGTNSGKSTVVVDLLATLQPHVNQIIVISPTDRQTRTYEDIVPLPCIHYDLTEKLLTDLWERQMAFASVYKRACNPVVLAKLFGRIPGIDNVRNMLGVLRDKLNEHKEQMTDEQKAAKVAEMDKSYEDFAMNTQKKYIGLHINELERMALTKEEAYALKYYTLNPRIVLVFDDCTSLLNNFKKNKLVMDLFYQGRWAFFTVIISCHTDKALQPEVKKGAFITIFTDPATARGSFGRSSNNFDKDMVRTAEKACRVIFESTVPHQKLVWMRERGAIYKMVASRQENFKFGSPYIWEYCNKIKVDTNAVPINNRFITGFK